MRPCARVTKTSSEWICWEGGKNVPNSDPGTAEYAAAKHEVRTAPDRGARLDLPGVVLV
jgi:hypothetical protein